MSSHRKLTGRVIVVGKKAFRVAFQPFIAEVLRKQVMFNETVISALQSCYAEISSLESASISMRAGLDDRVRKLEAEVARLQQQLDQQRAGHASNGVVHERPRDV